MTVDRVTPAEMVELAGNGAKVMHSKAAELAHSTNTPYAVRACAAISGTLIDEERRSTVTGPVTGITALRDVAFFRVIQGLSDEGGRATLDRELFDRLAAQNISIDMINVNDAGVFFVVDDDNVERVRTELHNLNLALRVRMHCAKLSIVGAGMRGTPGVMAAVVRAVTEAGVEIIHSTDSNITISVLVPDDAAGKAEQALHDYFHLGRRRQRRHEGARTAPHRDDHAVRCEGAVDVDEAVRLAQFLVDRGNDGFVVSGTTGEAPALETKRSWRFRRDQVGPRRARHGHRRARPATTRIIRSS